MLQISQRAIGDILILDVAGELTFAEDDKDRFNALIAEVINEGYRKILISLEGRLLFSPGVGVLISAFVKLRNAGGILTLTSTKKRIRGIFQVCGGQPNLFFQDEAEAVRWLRSASLPTD